MSTDLTIDAVKGALPPNTAKLVNQEIVDSINNIAADEFIREQYKENILGYGSVMAEGKFKLSSYLDAVKYVSFRKFCRTNIEAFQRAFPDRYQKFMDKKYDAKTISAYVSAYNKNAIVAKVTEQSMVSIHILNHDKLQQAINVQAEIMLDEDVSPKVRSDAANSLMTHLKPPETAKTQIDINVSTSDRLDDLARAAERLAESQYAAISGGGKSALDIAHSSILEGEVVSSD